MVWLTGEEFRAKGGDPDKFASANGLYDEAWLDPAKSFFATWNGRYNNYDGHYGCQCTDIMRQYILDVLKLSPYSAIPNTGNAADIFTNFKPNRYFDKIYNGKYNVPKHGDIIFWKWYPLLYGWAGHVAIVDKADLYYVFSFDQNYPTGRPCLHVKHGSSKWLNGYRGCLGWLHPKQNG